ncbi:MAG: HDOD domain-containing protein [Saccharospirillaceae bacterium]|nr:HDOD domain-containing protein [Pseudomonadales bacterium]NRB79671.1 HDOD domain-containing protein [Saccharospirillaceae bacterium]
MISITQQVIDDVSKGFKIPSVPETLLKVHDICNDKNGNITELAALIASDIGLSSAILKTINSPFYGMNRAVSDITQAVMLLGMGSVSTLISGILIKQSFKGESAINFERLWDNASLVAQTMVYIGQNIEDKIPPENLYSAGLFHDCGIAAMSMRYTSTYLDTLLLANEDYSKSQVGHEDRLYGTNHAIMGYFIASGWKLPRDICVVILNHHEPDFLDINKPHMENLMYATLKVADNIISKINRDQNINGWDEIKDKCFDQLGIHQDKYDALFDDIEELWK